MDLGNLQANALQSYNAVKENPYAYYSLIFIFIVIIIVFLRRQYYKIVAKELAEPIFIRNIRNTNKNGGEVAIDRLIQTPGNGSSFTFSSWLFVNDFKVREKALKHVFHKGDLDMNTMAPGVFIAADINSIAILLDTKDRVKTTVTTKKILNSKATKVIEDPTGVYPMDKPCGCEELLKAGSDQMASFVKDDAGNGVCYTYNKVRDTQKDDNAVTWTKTGGNILTMNPYTNPKILHDDNSCIVVENIPLQRWFHLVVVVNTSSVEVYVDGKLYKTLVLQSPVKLNAGSLYAGLQDGYDGMINELRYFPYSLRYMDVYNMYTRGPTPFYFMYLFRGKQELYDKHLKNMAESIKDVAQDAGSIFSNLSEDIFGEAQDYSGKLDELLAAP